MVKQEHRPKHETQQMIMMAVAQSDGLTRTQIARFLGRTKTPHLIQLIDELVDDGYLIRDIKHFANGVQGYVYRMHPDVVFPPDTIHPDA